MAHGDIGRGTHRSRSTDPQSKEICRQTHIRLFDVMSPRSPHSRQVDGGEQRESKIMRAKEGREKRKRVGEK